MFSESALREQVANFLKRAISLEEFADWLARASWNMHQHVDLDLQRLAGEIELSLVEYSNGHRSEDEVRALLMSLLMSQGTHTVSAAPVVVVSYENPTSLIPGVGQIVSAQATSANLMTQPRPAVDSVNSVVHIASLEVLTPA